MTDNSDKRRINQARKRAKRREKIYKERLAFLKKIGVYSPKSDDLTHYRRTRINAEWTKWSQYAPTPGKGEKFHRPDKYFYVDATKNMSKGRTANFLKNAKSMNMVTTPKGVFIAREGQRRATIVWDMKRKEFDIHLKGKVKRGERKGKRIEQKIPVAPIEHVGDEERRLRLMAEAFGPLKKNEILTFVVEENGVTGYHRHTYKTVEDVMRALNKYHADNPGHRLAFFRLVTVVKRTMVEFEETLPSRSHRVIKKKKSRAHGKRST